ncbi:hypothetical protein LJC48_07340 [Desulfovibrio sp. OttesenSCG-928-C06]|nr:hypothetical protein [Desulfovibrio sp. OttesenSCG-928-C06]
MRQYRIIPSIMLNPEIITIGMLKQAYGLNTNNVDDLLEALLPDKVFPYALWQQAHIKFWAGAIQMAKDCDKVKAPQLPTDTNLPEKHFPYPVHAHALECFFASLLRTIKSTGLENGINYILDAAYGDDFPHKEEKDTFFSALRQEEWNQRNRASGHLEIESMAAASYHFISVSLVDTITIDKKSAILWLHYSGSNLSKEVKGITKSLVNSIIASEAQPPPTSTPHEQPHISNTFIYDVHQNLSAVINQSQENIFNFMHAECHAHTDTADNIQSASNETSPPTEEVSSKTTPTNTIIIPRALWEHKTPRTACKNLTDADFPSNIIALVLKSRCGQNKTQISKLLGTYPKKITDYLLETAHLTIVDS